MKESIRYKQTHHATVKGSTNSIDDVVVRSLKFKACPNLIAKSRSLCNFVS